MSEITRILNAAEQGDPQAAAELLPLVYDELRRLAVRKMAEEKPGQTLQATALVHEAYLRLVDVDQQQQWNGRGHFFAAAAEAMRRILVEKARRAGRTKHGGELSRQNVDDIEIATPAKPAEVLAIDEALGKLAIHSDQAAQLVKLRYFAGLTIREAADVLGVSSRKADQIWAYARAWLLAEMGEVLP
jgi:RNA polymerase sigma factor (TIGR02999 family)